MLTLILETSTEKGCLILASSGEVLETKALPAGPELSKCLALEVKNILNERRPELIAVGTGPGSYTGIRVGTALAKALAYGWKIPLIGFCSLKAFGPLPVLVDARMGGFYALLDHKPELISPLDPRLQSLPSFASPHPNLIQKRFVSPAVGQETNPNASLLARMIYNKFLEEGEIPLELNYISSP